MLLCAVEEAEKIGIRELRQHASRYVAMAKAGMRIAGDRPGKLWPTWCRPTNRSEFERMVAAGQVPPATGNISDLLPPPCRAPGNGRQPEVLQEMRDEERY